MRGLASHVIGVRGDNREQHPLLIAGTADNQDAVIHKLQVGRHYGPRAIEQHQLHRDHAATDRLRRDAQNAAAGKTKRDHAAAFDLLFLTTYELIGGKIKHNFESADHS